MSSPPVESSPPPPPPPHTTQAPWARSASGPSIRGGDVLRAFLHELSLALISGVIVTAIYFLFVNIFQVTFHMMHLVFIFLVLLCFPYFDRGAYPYDTNNMIYLMRAAFNLLFCLTGFLITGMSSRTVAKSPKELGFNLWISYCALTGLIAGCRVIIHIFYILISFIM